MPPLAQSPPRPRLGRLDPLRGALALCVAVYHLSVWFRLTPSGSWANMAIARLGNYGVSTFFIVSGFVLFRTTPWERLRDEGILRFWRRRVLRLAPVFYLACALNLGLGLGMGPAPTPAHIAENLTLTFGAIHPNHALVIGGWYVGLVALLYFAYPMLAWARATFGLGFLVVLALATTAASLAPTLRGIMALPITERFHAYVLWPNQVFLMASGALVAGLHARTEKRLSPRVAGGLGLPLVALMLSPRPLFYDHLAAVTGGARYLYVFAATAIVALAAFCEETPPGPSSRALTRVGLWSYGLYLLHPFAMRLVAPRVSGTVGFALALGLALFAAAIAHRWIEAPIERFARR